MARTVSFTVVDEGVEYTVTLPTGPGQAQALRLECIQQLITSLLTGGSLPLAILQFIRCSFNFSTEEKAELRAMLGE